MYKTKIRTKYEANMRSLLTVVEPSVFGVGELALVVYTVRRRKEERKIERKLNIIPCKANNIMNIM